MNNGAGESDTPMNIPDEHNQFDGRLQHINDGIPLDQHHDDQQ